VLQSVIKHRSGRSETWLNRLRRQKQRGGAEFGETPKQSPTSEQLPQNVRSSGCSCPAVPFPEDALGSRKGSRRLLESNLIGYALVAPLRANPGG